MMMEVASIKWAYPKDLASFPVYYCAKWSEITIKKPEFRLSRKDYIMIDFDQDPVTTDAFTYSIITGVITFSAGTTHYYRWRCRNILLLHQ